MLKVMCLLSSKSFGSEKIRREVSRPKLRDQILINAGDLWIDLKEIVGRIDRLRVVFVIQWTDIYDSTISFTVGFLLKGIDIN